MLFPRVETVFIPGITSPRTLATLILEARLDATFTPKATPAIASVPPRATLPIIFPVFIRVSAIEEFSGIFPVKMVSSISPITNLEDEEDWKGLNL